MIPALPNDIIDPVNRYLALLDHWNRIHALTALPLHARMEELILDSAVLLPFMNAIPDGSIIMDFGTGMGIPAMVLALHRPGLHILATDRSGKKIAFVRQAALELGIPNLEALRGHLQDLPPAHAQAGVSKATAALSDLANWWERHGQPGAPFFALQGPSWNKDLPPDTWDVVAHPYSLPTKGQRYVVEMKKRRD